MGTRRVGWWYYATLILAAPVTFLVHEAAHWITGIALGYPMRFSMNLVAPVEGYTTSWHALLVTAAGPAVTILQAVVAFVLVQRRALLAGYAFLFLAAFMRFAAMLMTPFNPNDEARLGAAFDLGAWTMPLVTVLLLVFLTWRASLRLGLHWSVNAWSYLVASATITLIVFGDSLLAGTTPLS